MILQGESSVRHDGFCLGFLADTCTMLRKATVTNQNMNEKQLKNKGKHFSNQWILLNPIRLDDCLKQRSEQNL